MWSVAEFSTAAKLCQTSQDWGKVIGVRVHNIVNAEGSQHREQHSSKKAHHIVNAVYSSCYLRRRQYERTSRISATTARHSPDLTGSRTNGYSRSHRAQPGLVVQMAAPIRQTGLAGLARSLPRSAAPQRSLLRPHAPSGCGDPSALAQTTHHSERPPSHPGRTASLPPAQACSLAGNHQTHPARCRSDPPPTPTQARLFPTTDSLLDLRAARDG